MGLVGAHHRDPGADHEPVEGLLDGGQVAVVVEVVGLHVGDDRDLGVELGEGAVALVGLDDEQVAPTPHRTGADLVDVAAHDERRRQPRLDQHQGQHRRRGGLAVGARDRERAAHAGDGGQHLGPAQHRDAALAGGGDLGVALRDGRRHRHHVGPLDVGRLVADRHRDALGPEAVEARRRLHVGPRHAVAHRGEHRRDGAHAGPADADRRGRAAAARRGRAWSSAQAPATSSTSAATRSAASRRA